MEPATITAVVQAIVTIITTLSGVWAIFTKKTNEIKLENTELKNELVNLKSEMRQYNAYQASKKESTYSK